MNDDDQKTTREAIEARANEILRHRAKLDHSVEASRKDAVRSIEYASHDAPRNMVGSGIIALANVALYAVDVWRAKQ